MPILRSSALSFTKEQRAQFIAEVNARRAEQRVLNELHAVLKQWREGEYTFSKLPPDLTQKIDAYLELDAN